MKFDKPFKDIQVDFPLTQEGLQSIRGTKTVSPELCLTEHIIPFEELPEVGSDQWWAELLEVVWARVLADTPFSTLGRSPVYRLAQQELSRLLEWYPSASTDGRLFDHDALDGRYRYISPILSDKVIKHGSWEMHHTSGIVQRNSAFSGATLAETVHNDHPLQFCLEANQWLASQNVQLRSWVPETGCARFVDWGVVHIEYLIGKMVYEAGKEAFRHKYYHGLPRPEEGIGAYLDGTLEAPEWFANSRGLALLDSAVGLDKIRADNRLLTAYPEGSPNHPTAPAGHSTIAGTCIILAAFYDLTRDQYEALMRFAWNVGHGRTWAGVHYRSDNTYGLRLGTDLALERLGGYILETDAYNAEQAVAELQPVLDSIVIPW